MVAPRCAVPAVVRQSELVCARIAPRTRPEEDETKNPAKRTENGNDPEQSGEHELRILFVRQTFSHSVTLLLFYLSVVASALLQVAATAVFAKLL